MDIPAFLPALKYPYEHGTDGEDHDGQPERNHQAREQPPVPFPYREEPREFFSYHSDSPSALYSCARGPMMLRRPAGGKAAVELAREVAADNAYSDPIDASRSGRIVRAFRPALCSAQVHTAGFYDDAGFLPGLRRSLLLPALARIRHWIRDSRGHGKSL